MRTLIDALNSERLKLKHSLALWCVFLSPLCVIIYIVTAYLIQGIEMLPPEHKNTWIEYYNLVAIFWTLLMLPLYATLQTALLASLEHRNSQWKHIFALPISRGIVYVSKHIVSVFLIALSHIALMLFATIGGCIIWLFRPELGFLAPIPWQLMFLQVGISFFSSWLITALHTWIGLRWSSFVIAIVIGIVCTVSGITIIRSEWGSFYPWALTGGIINNLHKSEPFRFAEFLFGCFGGITLILLSSWDLIHRETA